MNTNKKMLIGLVLFTLFAERKFKGSDNFLSILSRPFTVSFIPHRLHYQIVLRPSSILLLFFNQHLSGSDS
jgi:ABC-type sulfate transport system permease subunit